MPISSATTQTLPKTIMRKLTICCFVLLSCCIATKADAQGFGTYMDKGPGGVIGVTSFDGGTSVGATGSYVFSPLIEAKVSAYRSSYDDSEVTATGVGPALTVYPVRQSPDIPVSVALSGSYAFVSYSGDYIDNLEERGTDVSANSYSVDGSIFRVFEATPKLRIVPSVNVGYQNFQTEFSTSTDSEVNTEDGVGFGAAAIVLFQTSETMYFTVTPNVSVYEGDTSYGIAAAIALPQ